MSGAGGSDWTAIRKGKAGGLLCLLRLLLNVELRDTCRAVVEVPRQPMSHGIRPDTEANREQDIQGRPYPSPRAQEVERLEAKSREGRKAATESDHDVETQLLRDRILPIRQRECPNKSYDQRAEDIDQHHTVRQLLADGQCPHLKPITRHRAERPPERQEQASRQRIHRVFPFRFYPAVSSAAYCHCKVRKPLTPCCLLYHYVFHGYNT